MSEHLIELNGVRQWVRVVGGLDGAVPLVLVHGGPGGNHFVFERTVGPLLEAVRPVIYWEQRGSGRSDAPSSREAYSIPLLVADLHALVHHLGVPRVDLLGYSFGGGLVLEYARAHPGTVRRVIAQAPAFRFDRPELVAHQLSGFCSVAEGEVAGRFSRIMSSAELDAIKLGQVWEVVDTATVDRFLFQSPRWAAFNRRMWTESGLVNSGDMHRALPDQPPTDTPEHLAEIERPILVLTGCHDRNVSPAWSRHLADTLPNARLHCFEHSAHFPDIEETGAYASVVTAFLA